MKKSLPHLASRNDEIAKEVLAFLCIMLFNANSQVQVSITRTKLVWSASLGLFGQQDMAIIRSTRPDL